MSETQTETKAPEPKYEPQNVLALEEDQTPGQEPEAAEGASEAKPEPSEAETEEQRRKSERRREAQRIGYLTKQRYAEKARADAAEQRLREYEARIAQQNGQPHQPSQQDVERLIDQWAEEKLARQQYNAAVEKWDAEGGDQFGVAKFRDACKTVADMASDQQRAMLLQVAMDVEGGQRAVMEMASDPEVAERVLSLPPHKMALEIAKLGANTPPPRPVSNAPPPIRPPQAGRARGEPDPERGDMQAFLRWSDKQPWRR